MEYVEYEIFAGKNIGNNVYIDMRGKKAIFKKTRLKYKRNSIFSTIKRLGKKYKPDYEGKVYLETFRCFSSYLKMNWKSVDIIIKAMQYLDKLSTFQINYVEKPDLNELALKTEI